jgi:16S rRNA (adenine1518-N6/adenine1519-N6)-dimethyltransferase
MSALAADGLPRLADVIRSHEIAAKKSLGQNFLLDLNLTRRIARQAAPLAGRTVVEVGPGPGGLTRALLAEGSGKVVAIERDDRCLEALAEIAQRYPGRLDVHGADALRADYPALIAGHAGKAVIAANLPYGIATKLLVGWLESEPWPPWFDRMVLMFQREVAERIVAAPGSKTYGRLSVLSSWRAQAKILFDVNPSAFVPPPKVTSSVVQFIPRAVPLPCSRAALERVTEAAFGQRRKMLRGSLKTLGRDTEALLALAGVDGTARAEELNLPQFCALARAHTAMR